MKKLNFSVVALIASVMMLTSCLGNGGNSISGLAVGYIDYDMNTLRPVFYNSLGYPVTSSVLNDYYTSGRTDYVIAYIELDLASTENQVGNGLYYANISSIAKIDDNVEAYAQLDTISTITNELPCAISSYRGGVNNKMFFDIAFEEYQQYQNNRYYMNFDLDQEPKTVNGEPVYEVYLRAQMVEEGKGEVYKNNGPILGIDVSEITERLKYKIEDSKYNSGYATLYFRINTVKGIDKETGERTGWVTTDPIGVYVTKDDK